MKKIATVRSFGRYSLAVFLTTSGFALLGIAFVSAKSEPQNNAAGMRQFTTLTKLKTGSPPAKSFVPGVAISESDLEAGTAAARATDRKLREALTAAAGPVYLTPFLQNNAVLNQAYGLIHSAPFSKIEPATRQPLEGEYDTRAKERDSKLPEANSVDKTQDRLFPMGERLDSDRARLVAESENYDAQRRAFEARCNPSHDENDYKRYCIPTAAKLNAWNADLNKRINAYNNELASFKAQFQELQTRFTALNDWIVGWQNKLDDLIKRISDAIKGQTQTCSDEVKQKLDAEVNAKCKLEERACKGDQDCGTLRNNLAKNQACKDARQKVVDVCFGGKPDAGHQQAINDAQGAIDNCLELIAKKCGIGRVTTP